MSTALESLLFKEGSGIFSQSIAQAFLEQKFWNVRRRRWQWSGGGPWLWAVSLRQLSDAYPQNSPWWLPDPELGQDWEQRLFVLAQELGAPRGRWDHLGRWAEGWCLLWLGTPALEAVPVKEKISRAPEFIGWQPPIFFFPNCSWKTVSWWLLIEIFLQFQDW